MSETDKKYHEFYEQAYASLDETQRIAVDHIEGPVMVIGGPGTGKTKVLCTRVAKVVLKTASAPGSILCITHRDYTAAAIRRCLLAMAGPGAYQVNVYSFESFCREIIQDNPFVFGDISTRPVNGLDNLEAIKRGKNYHDTQSQVNCVVSAFEENKNLLAIYQEKCRYIFIDEYEDTPGLENRLVTLLASSSEKPNLFVAADDDQAIYPDPSTRLTGFASAYAKHLLTVVLKKNYRFSQPIPDMSTSLISMNSQRFINVFNAQAREPAVCNPTAGQHTPHTVILEYETRQEEIIATINQAQQLITDGTAPHKIAVIYRGDKYGQQLAEHFSVKNLPVYSSRSLNILEMPLIKKLARILHYLAAELHLPYSGDNLLFEILHFDFFNIPPIEIATVAVEVNEQKHQGTLTSIRKFLHDKINMPARTLFDIPLNAALANTSQILEKLIGEAANVNLQTTLEKVVRDAGLFAYIMESDSSPRLLLALTALLDFAKEENLRNPDLDLHSFLDTLELMRRNGISLSLPGFTGTEKRLHLLTVEDSKGREFEYVFLTGCEAASWEKRKEVATGEKLPGASTMWVESRNDDEQHRRMFYVALTRARTFLNISYARSGAAGNPLEPSRFLIEILRQCKLEVKQAAAGEQAVLDFMMLQFRDQAPRLENTREEFIKRIVDNFVMSVTALNNYLRCPLEFYFKNIIRIPVGKYEAAEFGSAVHFAIQRLFERMKADPNEQFPSIQEMIADFTGYMNRQRGSFTREGFGRRLEYGKELLTNYYERYVTTWPRIVAVELNIRNVVWRGVPLKGKIDKLEFNGREVNVVDYKSGDMERALLMLNPPSDQMPDGGDYWRQAVFYKILVDLYGGKGWKATSSEIDFVEPGKNGQHEKYKILIRPEDIETVSQQIVRVWGKIQQHDFYTGCGRQGCFWCGLVR